MPHPGELDFLEVEYGSPEYEALVALRYEVLRRPLGRTFSPEQLATERDDRHLACFRDGMIVGCLLLADRGKGTMQMRQVAVRPELQGQGVGRALAEHAEALVSRLGYQRMILHARETAAGFYERLGYARVGEPFLEIGLLHWEMTKRLNGAGSQQPPAPEKAQ
jgi:predicted GNAT family N-acyltransferase